MTPWPTSVNALKPLPRPTGRQPRSMPPARPRSSRHSRLRAGRPAPPNRPWTVTAGCHGKPSDSDPGAIHHHPPASPGTCRGFLWVRHRGILYPKPGTRSRGINSTILPLFFLRPPESPGEVTALGPRGGGGGGLAGFSFGLSGDSSAIRLGLVYRPHSASTLDGRLPLTWRLSHLGSERQ